MSHDDQEPFETIRCSSWEDLLKRLDEFEPGWLFRGQREAEWLLTTTLERLRLRRFNRWSVEQVLRHEFRRRAHNFVAAGRMPEDDLEWLALMQHFGAPTRLLDVTHSPYVGAYFALEVESDQGESALWAIHERECLRLAGQRGAEQDQELKKTRDVLVTLYSNGDGDEVDVHLGRVAGHFSNLVKNETKLVVPVEPERLSERMSAQQGSFLAVGNVDVSFADSIAPLRRDFFKETSHS